MQEHKVILMYRYKHFSIHKLVPPDVFNERQEKAWELLDERLLITLDRLRERYGPIILIPGRTKNHSDLQTELPDFSQAPLKHFFPR